MHYWVRNQVTLSQTRSIAEYQKTIAGNIEELENISRLTENILFFARADKNNVLVKLDSLSLNKEVENLLDYLEYLSDEKEICVLRSSAQSTNLLRIKFYCNECYRILLLTLFDIHQKNRVFI